MRVTPGKHVFIAGSIVATTLEALCSSLRRKGCEPVIIIDTMLIDEKVKALLIRLNEHQSAQILTATAAKALLQGHGGEFVYPYPKADSTATVAVLLDDASKVIVMERKSEPFKNSFALPGGFLNISLETLPECAVRELHEEVLTAAKSHLLSAEELVLIDVRSAPDRDPRGHVVDHGYAWLVPEDRKDGVIAALKAGDDAKPDSACVRTVDEVLVEGLAFDHDKLLRSAIARLKT
jgi:8-oxo-dGTP diphosphatase